MTPTRGQLIILPNNNPAALNYFFSGGCGNDVAYMFARQNDIVIGGTWEDDKVETDPAHFADFVDAARKSRRPNAPIEEGYKSTLLCHLGNIAIRSGRALKIDPTNGHILEDKDAVERFWSREYRPEWEPKV